MFQLPDTRAIMPATLYSASGEEAVLGSVLINPDALYDVQGILGPGDFHIVRHSWIYDSFLALKQRKSPIDIITLVGELERRGQLVEAGGQAYISQLINSVPTAVNAEAYAGIVRELSDRRAMVAAAGRIAQAAYREDQPLVDSQAEAHAALVEAMRDGPKSEVVSARQGMHTLADEMDARASGVTDVFSYPTGLQALDKKLGGIELSDLILVACRPGEGKTTLLINHW